MHEAGAEQMFEMASPWWSFLARGAIVYVFLMVLIRVSGKRTVGEFTPFDLVVVVLLGESVQGAITGNDESVPGGMLVAVTIVGLNYAVAFVTARSQAASKLFEGEPVLLARQGRTFPAALRRNNIPTSDLDEAVRHAGLSSLAEVELAMLEPDGEISIVPKERPQ